MAPGYERYEGDVSKLMDADAYKQFERRLPEFAELRIQMMNDADIEVCVLSQTSPGLQIEKDAAVAIRKAQEANDFLFAQIEQFPSRFAGFAHLSLHDPRAATVELIRCVRELGFKGAMINGHTNGVYLDEDICMPFWEAVAELDVPVYLHPASAFDSPHMYKDYPVLVGATWGWTVETATHALRLIVSGLFDRIPSLKVILGHMGETLPFMLWRLDSRWKISKQPVPLNKSLSQYLRDNFFVTTSGVCDVAPLMCTLESVGSDRVLFSTDYPFEDAKLAAEFIDTAPISEDVRAKICYENARRILKLS
jgi:2,3-dihydroxybenzoate decarboxylase